MPRKAFPLRVDDRVLAAVGRVANAQLRSVNAQIEVLLREALAARGVKLLPSAPADDTMSEKEGEERDGR